MFISIIPLLCALIGLVMYAVSTNTKAVEIGRLMFAMGLLVTLFAAMRQTVHF